MTDDRLHLASILTLAITAVGCTHAIEPYSKEEARLLNGMTEQGEDICALSGWYDDEICDDFCPEADDACAVCLAYPACAPGEETYDSAEECPADASCREVSICGSTIWCWADVEPVCAGPNPEGCVGTGCEDGFVCDTTMGTAPSACACDPESGAWTCTADLNGGICVPAE